MIGLRKGNAGLAPLTALLVSCGLPSTNVKIPDKPLPAEFEGQQDEASVAELSWREYFADERLTALIGEALEANPDVFIAVQRIELARAGVTRATGAMLPQVSAVVGGGVTKPARYTAEGSGNATTEIMPGRMTPNPLGDMALGLESSWEIDVWGRLRNSRRAVVAQYLATVEGLNLVTTSLVADVSVAYFELIALDRTLEVLARTIAQQAEALEVVRLQKQAGQANELAVQQFAAQLADTKALQVEARQRVRELENQVNLLRGSYPRPVARAQNLPLLPLAIRVGTGLPAGLLQRRPDVRQAEQWVRATKFDLKAARAAFFPRLEISAGIGYQAFNPRYLFSTPASVGYSAGAGLVAPLINRNAIKADFASAKAAQIEAMYQYQKVVLAAYVEVANGLIGLESNAELVSLKEQQKLAVDQIVATADNLYRAGQASYFEVLMAQQSTLAAELELIDALRRAHLARVAIYKALGGGWQRKPGATTQATPASSG